MHDECIEAARMYRRILDKAATVIANFCRKYVLRERLSEGEEALPPSTPVQDCSFTFTDVVMSSTIQEAVQEKIETKEQKKATAKVMLNISMGEKSEVQKRWTTLSREMIHEHGLRTFIKISLRSASRCCEEACKSWTFGNLQRALHALETAKETTKRTVDHCGDVLHVQLRTQFLQQAAADQEKLSDLESYLQASTNESFDVSADLTLSFAINGASSLTFLTEPQEGDEMRDGRDNTRILAPNGPINDRSDLPAGATSILSSSLSESSGLRSAKKPARSIAEQVAAQKQQHLGLLPERLLAHEMDERIFEEHLRTFQQDLKLA
eukprot:Tamp_06866.p1 GENE.Tamp_06866~~Tamp_06866.p1  ORF type:complete len:324 (+),score=52.10 Tamp_06866:921-1892(+)